MPRTAGSTHCRSTNATQCSITCTCLDGPPPPPHPAAVGRKAGCQFNACCRHMCHICSWACGSCTHTRTMHANGPDRLPTLAKPLLGLSVVGLNHIHHQAFSCSRKAATGFAASRLIACYIPRELRAQGECRPAAITQLLQHLLSVHRHCWCLLCIQIPTAAAEHDVHQLPQPMHRLQLLFIKQHTLNTQAAAAYPAVERSPPAVPSALHATAGM